MLLLGLLEAVWRSKLVAEMLFPATGGPCERLVSKAALSTAAGKHTLITFLLGLQL